jgi:predicted glycosyltransferase
MSTPWIDVFNGPHVHFFQHAGEYIGNHFLTARKYKPIPELLQLYRMDAHVVGEHGGKRSVDKLLASSERVISLAKTIAGRDIDLVVHKHSVEAARVAWGLGIPSISFVDNELMVPQNMLVCPLSNVLIAPIAISQYVLRNFTPSHVSILQFDGVSEIANVHHHKGDEGVLNLLGLDASRPIVVFRGEPILASYNTGTPLSKAIVQQIRKAIPRVQIVQIGREGDPIRNHLPAFDARSLFYFADIVISGGGTMTREAALLGTNAITYFNKPLAVDLYLVNKGVLRSFPGKEILKVNWARELRRKRNTVSTDMFEHPFSLIAKARKLIDVRNGK